MKRLMGVRRATTDGGDGCLAATHRLEVLAVEEPSLTSPVTLLEA
jgi:hypothetical protein